MKKLILMSITASAAMLLAGCGGGSSDSTMQVSMPPAGTTPAVPVVPSPSPPSSPSPESPMTPPASAPDFTDYLSKLVVSAESEEPAATDDIEFVFAGDEDDAVFATLLLEM